MPPPNKVTLIDVPTTSLTSGPTITLPSGRPLDKTGCWTLHTTTNILVTASVRLTSLTTADKSHVLSITTAVSTATYNRVASGPPVSENTITVETPGRKNCPIWTVTLKETGGSTVLGPGFTSVGTPRITMELRHLTVTTTTVHLATGPTLVSKTLEAKDCDPSVSEDVVED